MRSDCRHRGLRRQDTDEQLLQVDDRCGPGEHQGRDIGDAAGSATRQHRHHSEVQRMWTAGGNKQLLALQEHILLQPSMPKATLEKAQKDVQEEAIGQHRISYGSFSVRQSSCRDIH